MEQTEKETASNEMSVEEQETTINAPTEEIVDDNEISDEIEETEEAKGLRESRPEEDIAVEEPKLEVEEHIPEPEKPASNEFKGIADLGSLVALKVRASKDNLGKLNVKGVAEQKVEKKVVLPVRKVHPPSYSVPSWESAAVKKPRGNIKERMSRLADASAQGAATGKGLAGLGAVIASRVNKNRGNTNRKINVQQVAASKDI